MPPRGEDPADEEGAGERVVGVGSGVIADVLDRGEADGAERRVDDPVDDSIELFAEEIEGAGDGKAS